MLSTTKENYNNWLGYKQSDFEFFVDLQKCGVVSIEEKPNNEIWIWNVRIFDQFRGQGLSHKLIDDVKEFIKVVYPGCVNVYLLVDFKNEYAQKTYRKAGFKFLDVITQFCYKMELTLEK